VTLEELNALPDDEAAEQLRGCCGSSRWVKSMLERRPFTSVEELLRQASDAWRAADPSDWHEAFAHHPRIGERKSEKHQTAQGREWSADEQAALNQTQAGILSELSRVNQDYEKRFGHIYIVCAAGLTAEEMLAIARKRMKNDTDTELRVAAEEQRKITELRLLKLLGD